MATLKEFEEALRQHGMLNALAILDSLKKRDRENRSVAPARRVVGRKMTAELARTVLELHASTGMTQQEIAFKLGVNQGRVNEVIKRGKWLSGDPAAPEARSRDKAMERLDRRARARRTEKPETPVPSVVTVTPVPATPTTLLEPVQLAYAAEGERSTLPIPARPVLRRRVTPEPEPAVIVSAQLAFLDI